eukprot:Gb_13626 [translate_table: standard]
MSNRAVNVLIDRLTRRNHVTVLKLHRFCTLCPKFPTHNNLTTLSTTFHNKPQNTIASPSYSETSKQLVAQGLGLCNCTKPPIVHLLGIKLNSVLRKVKPFLNDRS